jgi:hypothetical protein
MPCPVPFWNARKDSARSNATTVSYEGLSEFDGVSDSDDERSTDAVADTSDHAHQNDGPLDQDTFGMAVVALVRDSYFLSRHISLGSCNRISRVATTLVVLFITMGFQIFLLQEIQRFVSAKAVHDIRNAYEKYENATYLCPEHPENCYKTFTNHYRGRQESKPNATVMFERLSGMSDEDQGNACRIPLSQPYFFWAVLSLWTTTVLREVRKIYTGTMRIMTLTTVDTMAHALRYGDGEDQDAHTKTHKVHVVGLTISMKLFFMMIQVCRFGIAVYLLWIGCRWLLGTTEFGDLILNAVALEFVLNLKEMFYTAFMPERNKIDLEDTRVPPYPRTIQPTFQTFVQTGMYMALAFTWAAVYMRYLQQVLPNYNWDVHVPCIHYIQTRYSV